MSHVNNWDLNMSHVNNWDTLFIPLGSKILLQGTREIQSKGLYRGLVVLCRAGVSAVDAVMIEKAVSEIEYFRPAIPRKAPFMALVKDCTTRLARLGIIFLVDAVAETGADIVNFQVGFFNAFNHILQITKEDNER